MTEAPVELVWNKGIARLCDRRIPDEFPDGLTYTPVPTLAGARMSPDLPADAIADPARYADIRAGEIVWVRLSWLPAFVRQVLPLIRAPFVLATGDSDSSVPSELPDLARPILASPYVIRWFAQNHDGAAPERMAPIPIGIDFHSMAERPIWDEAVASPSRQEATLTAIAARLQPLERRDPHVYIDFGWDASNRRDPSPVGARLVESRRAIVTRLRGRRDAVVCQTTQLPRSEMWRRRGQYAAVLSPHGGGLDCHRTWEALALGHLVLVPSSGLDPLFESLPVVPLRSWTEVTGAHLARWLSTHAGDTHARERLTSRYWLARMRSVTADS